MALRKASSYSKHYKKAYTRRSTVRSKNYIKAIPSSKVTKYMMGDIRKFNEGKFPYEIHMLSCEPIHIRDSAIEAARQFIHRNLDEQYKGNYYYALTLYPHVVLRENKMLTGAGADRMQTGMTLSFGVPVGIAAVVKENGNIFTVGVANKNDIPFVRKILKSVRAKLPCATKIVVTSREGKSI